MSKDLHVELRSTTMSSVRETSMQQFEQPKQEADFRLEVTGIPDNTKDEFVSLFFESEKSTGGGPIEELDFDAETGTAIIAFKAQES